jgi:outer membrane protein OmpA-like peptidoglycan-associated protein
MRWLLVVCLLVSSAAARPPQPLHLGYDADHLDLDHHALQFRPSRPIASATIVAIGEDGSAMGSGAASYDAPPQGEWWPITWTQPADARVMMLRLRAVAADGAATNLELIPWSVTVAHDDVNFRTDSAVIDPDERAKLDASLQKIEDAIQKASPYMKLTLYIAGHTDTVGTSASNRKLSLDRATAIGRYFLDKKLAVPVVVAGFGEDVLKVATPDNTDERANRRADYVLGPQGGTPPFKGAYLKANAQWHALK